MNNNSKQQQQQACAACKHQRRKCGPNCILAPYFPHHHQKQFLNAHKLFGIGKITSMIKPLSLPLRDIAMKTIIFESDVRAYDPSGGCYRLMQHLQSQIHHLTAELQLLHQQLAIYRARQQPQQQANPNDLLFAPLSTAAVPTYANANLMEQQPQHYIEQNQHADDEEAGSTFSGNGGALSNINEELNTWMMLNSMSLSSPPNEIVDNTNTRSFNNGDYGGFDHKSMLGILESEK